MSNKRIAVIGGTGFVGSVLVGQLLHKGYTVKVCDNLYKSGDSLRQYLDYNTFDFHLCDITREDDVKRVLGEDLQGIILLSGIVGLSECEKDPELTRRVNVDGWRIVSENVPEHVPFVGASTGSVYGKIDGVCDENTPVNPQSLYASTKLQGEEHLLNNGGIALRYATAAGVSPSMRFNLLPNELVKNSIENGKISIYEGGARRTFIDVRDFAHSLLYFVENFHSYHIEHNVYNVGSAQNNWTKQQLAEKISEKTQCELEVDNSGKKDVDSRDYEVDYNRLERTGFTMKYSLDETLDDIITYVRGTSEIRI